MSIRILGLPWISRRRLPEQCSMAPGRTRAGEVNWQFNASHRAALIFHDPALQSRYNKPTTASRNGIAGLWHDVAVQDREWQSPDCDSHVHRQRGSTHATATASHATASHATASHATASHANRVSRNRVSPRQRPTQPRLTRPHLTQLRLTHRGSRNRAHATAAHATAAHATTPTFCAIGVTANSVRSGPVEARASSRGAASRGTSVFRNAFPREQPSRPVYQQSRAAAFLNAARPSRAAAPHAARPVAPLLLLNAARPVTPLAPQRSAPVKPLARPSAPAKRK